VISAGGSVLRSVFVNYRRADSEGEAGRLFDDLVSRFGEKSVFMDVAAIEAGRDFRKAIDQSVATCSAVLAIMGLEWLELKNSLGQRRLDDPDDFVRLELASALRRDIPVIPVLVRGAKMPPADRLPDDLKDLAYRNAIELTHARWKSDVQVLIAALRPHLCTPEDASSTEAGGEGTAARNSSSSASTAPTLPTIDPKAIERVSMGLAVYIGPIAEVVVRRAAKRCSSVEELCTEVAQEIETDSDRVKFLKTSWS
jgi:hypothetical protein